MWCIERPGAASAIGRRDNRVVLANLPRHGDSRPDCYTAHADDEGFLKILRVYWPINGRLIGPSRPDNIAVLSCTQSCRLVRLDNLISSRLAMKKKTKQNTAESVVKVDDEMPLSELYMYVNVAVM